MKKKIKKKLLKKLKRNKPVLIVAAALVLLGAALLMYAFLRPVGPVNMKRLVTFYDRGTQHVILTQADTVQEALTAANITVDSHDLVEPSLSTKLTAKYIDIIIYRSRLVAVEDGHIHRTVLTVAQSPNAILKAAKLKSLGRKDKTSFRSGDTVVDGAALVLKVARAKLKSHKVVFTPRPDALTVSKGAQVFVDTNGVAHRETYYDLPMNIVIKACGAGESYHIRSDGAKVDQDGYVLVAANLGSYPRCTIVQTSLGPGKVYDTGGFAARYPYGFDLATDWTNYNGL